MAIAESWIEAVLHNHIPRLGGGSSRWSSRRGRGATAATSAGGDQDDAGHYYGCGGGSFGAEVFVEEDGADEGAEDDAGFAESGDNG